MPINYKHWNSCQWTGQIYPRLYELHLKHHCITAISAIMEQCFTLQVFIYRDLLNKC